MPAAIGLDMKAIRRAVLLRFLFVVAAGNLIWEIGQMPLYTLWLTGTGAEIAYAILHCTLGDLLIAGLCLTAAVWIFGGPDWPTTGFRNAAIAMIVFAVGYTVFSEWLNTEVLQRWAYRDIMPRLPVLGTGLGPILQWIIVPALAFVSTRARARR